LSWSSVGGEFLLEHWQKLILCLAVLLNRFLTLASGLACRRRARPRRAGAGCDSRRDAEA
ncbi:MAG: hypothetical protein ACXWO3_11965, partial [Isosphaeraceae bacterium]